MEIRTPRQGAIAAPSAIELDRERALTIRWSDGVCGEIPLSELRRVCPCATCRALREQLAQNPLTVLPQQSAGATAAAETAELVGNYALRLLWKDGHDTGIYDYGLLRTLSERFAASKK